MKDEPSEHAEEAPIITCDKMDLFGIVPATN